MKIKFWASLPDIATAVTLPGAPDSGAMVKLELPASEVGGAVLLQQRGAGRLLKVTIEVMDTEIQVDELVPEDYDG